MRVGFVHLTINNNMIGKTLFCFGMSFTPIEQRSFNYTCLRRLDPEWTVVIFEFVDTHVFDKMTHRIFFNRPTPEIWRGNNRLSKILVDFFSYNSRKYKDCAF